MENWKNDHLWSLQPWDYVITYYDSKWPDHTDISLDLQMIKASSLFPSHLLLSKKTRISIIIVFWLCIRNHFMDNHWDIFKSSVTLLSLALDVHLEMSSCYWSETPVCLGCYYMKGHRLIPVSLWYVLILFI